MSCAQWLAPVSRLGLLLSTVCWSLTLNQAHALGPKPAAKGSNRSPDAAAGRGEEVGVAPSGERRTRGAGHPDCAGRVPLFEHQVRKGEHLGQIAGRYGVRRVDLERLNPALEDPNFIVVGQKIRVCPEIFPRVRKRLDIEVRAGDTLSEIAHGHGLTTKELVGFQEGRVVDPNKLRVGQVLTVWVDGGLVEAFKPPVESKPKKSSKARRRRHQPVVSALPKHEHYHIKRPRLAYGTAKTIDLIREAISGHRGRFKTSPKVNIGDISRRGGGRLHPHLSHRRGRDVDVGYVLKGADATRTRFSGVNAANLDVSRTWSLVKGFLDTQQVTYIFMDYAIQKRLYEHAKEQGVTEDELDELFQYPRGRGRNHGIVRHWRSHKHHFHVRFRR